MVDELLSSPNVASQNDQGQQAMLANGSLQDPLFLESSQQSFPYSQYPGLLPPSGAAASPNDSEDEDEVEAAVVKSRPHGRQSSTFRSLTEITSQRSSQRSFFAPRYSSQLANLTKEPVVDMYGTSGKDDESEESDSGSDSEAEGKALASHIPAARRAGVSITKRK
ncbi:hypothetical protein BDZ97DRAFT_1916479 [Flammula alnicola]|nr:hypothetical protein BDZ97DRAFT_1916479 [Flammula alnicola]